MKTSTSRFLLTLALLMVPALIFFSPKQVSAGDDGWGVIDCYCGDGNAAFSSVGEPDKKHNKIDEGNKMHWLLVGPTGTEVEIVFAAEAGCAGTDPFEPHDPLKGTITNKGHKFPDFPSPKIAKGAGGPNGSCYSYVVYCKSPGGQTQSSTSDPIIDVPKP
jgi:hypothetical protein